MGPRIKIQNSYEKFERFSRINKWNQGETRAKCKEVKRTCIETEGDRPAGRRDLGVSTDWVTTVTPMSVPTVMGKPRTGW